MRDALTIAVTGLNATDKPGAGGGRHSLARAAPDFRGKLSAGAAGVARLGQRSGRAGTASLTSAEVGKRYRFFERANSSR